MKAGSPSRAIGAAFFYASFVAFAGGCVGGGDDTSSNSTTDAASAEAGGDAMGPDAPADGDARFDGAGLTDASSIDVSSTDGSLTADATRGPDAASSASTLALVRVANWSPDAPAVDFCLAPHGTGAFRGPFVAALVSAEVEAGLAPDGGAAGLSFPEVSAYALVSPGQYDARLVVGSDCSAGIAPDAKTLPALTAAGSATFALVGEASPADTDPGLQIAGFLDDSRPGAGLALRFIHAAPGVATIDVGIGGGASFATLFAGISFGQAGTSSEAPAVDGAAPAVDPQGYLSRPALVGATVGARPHGAPPGLTGDAGARAASAPNVSAAAGSVVSVVVTGGTATVPLGLLECVDNAGTVGPLSNCSVISR